MQYFATFYNSIRWTFIPKSSSTTSTPATTTASEAAAPTATASAPAAKATATASSPTERHDKYIKVYVLFRGQSVQVLSPHAR